MKDEWRMNVEGFGTIRVSEYLIEKILKYQQLSEGDVESGGILVGSYLNSNGFILIEDFTEPQKSDKQSRFGFFRSDKHSELARYVWNETGGKSTFLGLWHTHPEDYPKYSIVDIIDWNKTLNNSHYDGKLLLFFILGRTHLNCWIGIKKRFKNNIKLIGSYDVTNNI